MCWTVTCSLATCAAACWMHTFGRAGGGMWIAAWDQPSAASAHATHVHLSQLQCEDKSETFLFWPACRIVFWCLAQPRPYWMTSLQLLLLWPFTALCPSFPPPQTLLQPSSSFWRSPAPRPVSRWCKSYLLMRATTYITFFILFVKWEHLQINRLREQHRKTSVQSPKISSNQWKPLQKGNETNNHLYFPPSTPHVFLFSLLRQLLERMRRQERQTYGMINYRHRHFLCQQYRLYSFAIHVFRFAFLFLHFLHLWSKKENKEGNGEAFMCSVWEQGAK